ncbi:MAG: hypothetical protein HW421_3245 [Ignavibacteria bacterium]|nr:hypothetical protein [Ignavibacteria bacterium]
MTQILEKAWNSVLTLPEDRQDLIAYMILEEIEDEKFWDRQFEESQNKLSNIADKVRNDIKSGRVQKNGFGEL